MKEIKGKRYTPPDKGWTIAEMKCWESKYKGFFIRQARRKVRQFFKRLAKNNLVDKLEN